MGLDQKRLLVEPGHPRLSVERQCELLAMSRSSYYYSARPEKQENLRYMRMIDEQYLKTPFYGVPRMTAYLRRCGYPVNRKRVARLMRTMGIQGLQVRKHRRSTVDGTEHRVYPYLLRELSVERPNQLWSTDITYVPLEQGFLYLTAVLDWYSRRVLSWELSNSMDRSFCLNCLETALSNFDKPEIFNTDQGPQYTSRDFTGRLEKEGIEVSMDGRGRALDNVFIERLWRSVKYEYIYLHEHYDGLQMYRGLSDYFHFYNRDRPHQGLGYRTPEEVYNEFLASSRLLS